MAKKKTDDLFIALGKEIYILYSESATDKKSIILRGYYTDKDICCRDKKTYEEQVSGKGINVWIETEVANKFFSDN